MGIISGAKQQLQQELDLSCSQVEWAVTMLPLGAFFASMGCGNALSLKTTIGR